MEQLLVRSPSRSFLLAKTQNLKRARGKLYKNNALISKKLTFSEELGRKASKKIRLWLQVPSINGGKGFCSPLKWDLFPLRDKCDSSRLG